MLKDESGPANFVTRQTNPTSLLLRDTLTCMEESLEKSVLNLAAIQPSGYLMVQLEQTLNKEYRNLKKRLKSRFYQSEEDRTEILSQFDAECTSLRSIMIMKYNTVRQTALDRAVSRAVDSIEAKLQHIDVESLLHRVSEADCENALNEYINRTVLSTVRSETRSSVAGWLLSSQNGQIDMTDPAMVAQLQQQEIFSDTLHTKLQCSVDTFRTRCLAQMRTQAKETHFAPPVPPFTATAHPTVTSPDNLPPPPRQQPLTEAERLKQFRDASRQLAAQKSKAAAARAMKTSATNASTSPCPSSSAATTPPSSSVDAQRARAATWAATHLSSSSSRTKRPTTKTMNAHNHKKSFHQQRADALSHAIRLYGTDVALHTPPNSPTSTSNASPHKRTEQLDKLRSARLESRRISMERAESAAVAAGTRAARAKAAKAGTPTETLPPPPPTASIPAQQSLPLELSASSNPLRRGREVSCPLTPPKPPVHISEFSVPSTTTTRRRVKTLAKKRSLPSISTNAASPAPTIHSVSAYNAPWCAAQGSAFIFGSTSGTSSAITHNCVFEFKPLLSELPVHITTADFSLPESNESNESLLIGTNPGNAVPSDATSTSNCNDDEDDDVEDIPCPPARPMPVIYEEKLVNASAAREPEVDRDVKSEEEKQQSVEKERQLQEDLQREAQRLQDVADRIVAEARAEQEAAETAEKERRMAEKLAAEIRAEEEEAAVRAAEEAARRAVQDAIDAELAAKQAIEDEKIRAIEREREAAEAATEAARLAAEAQRIENERLEKERLEVENMKIEKKSSPHDEVKAEHQAEGEESLSHSDSSLKMGTGPTVSPTAVNTIEENPSAANESIEEDKKPAKRRLGVKALFRGLFGISKNSKAPSAKK